MSILGQTTIKKGKHLPLAVCTQQRQHGKQKYFHTHQRNLLGFFLCTSPIQIQLSCSCMFLRLHVRYINSKLVFKWTYLSIFNNLVYLVNRAGVRFFLLYFKRPHKSESRGTLETPKFVHM